MNKYFIGLLILFAFLPIVFSESYDFTSLSWDGTMEINLQKESFNPSEPVSGTITVYNIEEYPILGLNIILQIGEGEYDYPSQYANEDNIVYEKIVSVDGWILPHSKRTIPFELPAQVAGNYRIDAYSTVGKSKFIGANWIFLGPISKNFSVIGETQEKAKIYREITEFEKVVGPIGAPVDAGSEVSGKIYVFNPSNTTKSGLKVGIKVCEWGSGFCKNEKENLYPLPSIAPYQTNSVSVSIIAPNIPSAYEINITVYNNDDSIESMYKNRLIVKGGTAKVRKIMLNGLDTENYSFDILLSASPDHYTTPDFENFTLKMTSTKEGQLVEEKQIDIQKIIFDEIQKHSFQPSDLGFDRVCFSVEKENIKYDESCLDVSLGAMQENYYEANPRLVKVVWNYERSLNNLNIVLTKDIPINARVRLTLDQETIFVEDIKNTKRYEKNITQDAQNLVLVVDDFDAQRQQIEHINLRVEEEFTKSPITNERPQDSIEICQGIFCTEGLVCDSQPISVNNQPCCTTKCIVAQESTESNEFLGIPLVVWIALIILIIASIIGSSALKRVTRK